MALHFPGGTGNWGVVIGGLWNTGGGDPDWNSPFNYATALTLAGIIKPDSPFAGGPDLFHQSNGSSYQDVWRLTRQSGGALQLQVYGRDGGGNPIIRTAITTSTTVIQAAAWNRWMVFWDGARDEVAFWNNGVLYPCSLSGTAVPQLTAQSAPCEIGCESNADTLLTAGAYAEFAGWASRLPDADAIKHGRGIPIPQLSMPPARYVKLDKVTQCRAQGYFNTAHPQHGQIRDEVTGTVYGAATRNYDFGGGPYAAPYQGAFGDFALVPHPPLLAGPKPDADLLPERTFPLHVLRGHAGKRSSTPARHATTAATLQSALTASTYGDDVIVDNPILLTQTLTLPDARTWTVDASTPRQLPHPMRTRTAQSTRAAVTARAEMTARAAAGEPSYVRVLSPNLASLPPIAYRRVTLPDGTTQTHLHESARLGRPDYANLATIQMPDSGDMILNTGFNVYDRINRYWYFHGIHFLASKAQDSDKPRMMWLGGMDVAPAVWHADQALTHIPDHFVFNQCAFEADPLNTGTGCGSIMDQCSVLWHAVVNCYADKWWTIGGGDAKLMGVGGAGGPFHWENNDFRTPGALWFTGGGGSNFVDHTPGDFVVRRNWLHFPNSWMSSETNPMRGSWTVNISSTGMVTRASGLVPSGTPDGAWGGDPRFRPHAGWVMYSLTTGVARQIDWITPDSGFDNPITGLHLATAWPGQPVSNHRVHFQATSYESELTPLIYNSGTAATLADGSDAPKATTNTSTRHVSVSAALPDAVQVGHYFYLNNTMWYGDYFADAPIGASWTQPADGNGWGYAQSVTRAQCKRKQIATIDGDRRGFTFDATQDLFTAAETFPYSIVCFDGLHRQVLYHYKGAWENKTGRKWVQEGNVFEHTSARLYALEQANAGTMVGNIHIGPTDKYGITLATLLGGTAWSGVRNQNGDYLSGTTLSAWPFSTPNRYYFGAPWHSAWFHNLATNTIDTEYPVGGRLIKRLVSATVCELWPVDPRLGDASTMTEGDHLVSWRPNVFPWCEVSHQCIRYNVWMRGGPNILYGQSPYEGHIIPGGEVAWHDNLFLRFGDRSSVNGPPWTDLLLLANPQTSGFGGVPALISPGGQAVYEEPIVDGGNGAWRVDHNTLVRPTMATQKAATLYMGAVGSGILHPAKRVVMRDNVVVGADGAVNPTGLYPQATEVADTTGSWDPFTTVVSGNVLAGTGTLVPAVQRWTHGPRTSAVTNSDAVGMPNYANGSADGQNLANYALAPIYNTGTVSISGDGFTITHDSGDFPAAVQASQWFKTSTSAALAKIQMASGPLGIKWNVYSGAHIFGKRNGVVTPQGGGAPMAFQTNAYGLPDDQWVEAKNVAASRHFSLGIRCGLPQTINGYVIRAEVDPNYGEPSTLLGLYRLDNAVLSPRLAFVELVVLNATDVWTLQARGTVVTLLRNGTATSCSYNTAGDAIRYSSGYAALVSLENDASVQFTTYAAGDFGGAGGSRRALSGAADDFAGGGNQVLLETPYPERNVGAKSFAITFQGAGSDGSNPGADLTTLALMTQGVRDPTRIT